MVAKVRQGAEGKGREWKVTGKKIRVAKVRKERSRELEMHRTQRSIGTHVSASVDCLLNLATVYAV